MKTSVWAVCLACVAVTAAAQQAPARLTAQQMREDLEFLRDTWRPLDLSFSAEEGRAFDTIVAEALARVDTLTPAALSLEVARAVAVSRNAHTVANVDAYGTLVPIRVWWFADGLHIVEAHPDRAELLGARIVRIGRLTTEQAFERVRPFLSGTDRFARFLSVSHLISLPSLAHAGVTASVEEATFTLELNGERRIVVLGPEPPGGGPSAGGSSVPVPAPASNAARWPHVLDALVDPPLAYRGPLRDVMHAWIGPDGNVLYVRNENTVSLDGERLDDKLLGLLVGEVVGRRPRHVVVDLRLNPGGNFLNTVLFAQALPGLIPDDGRVFVLVGTVTASAAIATAMMLKGAGGRKVVFVGEPMGDDPQFWAENRELALPNSGILVSYAFGFHDWTGDCAANEHCFWGTEAFATRGLSMEPEIRAALAFADYAAGRDTVLEAALARIAP